MVPSRCVHGEPCAWQSTECEFPALHPYLANFEKELYSLSHSLRQHVLRAETIDYGPYGFLERFDPKCVCACLEDGSLSTFYFRVLLRRSLVSTQGFSLSPPTMRWCHNTKKHLQETSKKHGITPASQLHAKHLRPGGPPLRLPPATAGAKAGRCNRSRKSLTLCNGSLSVSRLSVSCCVGRMMSPESCRTRGQVGMRSSTRDPRVALLSSPCAWLPRQPAEWTPLLSRHSNLYVCAGTTSRCGRAVHRAKSNAPRLLAAGVLLELRPAGVGAAARRAAGAGDAGFQRTLHVPEGLFFSGMLQP